MPRISADRQADQEAQRLQSHRRKLVRWICPDCKNVVTGFLTPEESRRRTCLSMYEPWFAGCGKAQGFLPSGTVCGQILEVLLDEGYR